MRVNSVVLFAVLAVLAFPVASSGAPTLANPSFTTNASGWSTFGFADLFRDEAVYYSAPAAGSWGNLVATDTLSAPFIGTFVANTTYTLSFAYFGDGDGTVRVSFGSSRKDVSVVGGAWRFASLTWRPGFSMPGSVALRFVTAVSRSAPLTMLYVDDVSAATAA